MKKVLLGLILSVGMSGMAMANLNNDIFNSSEINTTCTIQTRIHLKDSNGNDMGYRDYCTQGTGSQCNGAVNGIVSIERTIRLTGTEPENNN